MPRKCEYTPFYPLPLMRGLQGRVRELYRLYNRALWRSRPSAPHRAALVALTLAWPAVAAWQSTRYLVRYGALARQRDGVGLARQWTQMLRWAMSRAMPPSEYYDYRLHHPPRPTHVDDYLWYDYGWRMFAMWNVGADTASLESKERLAVACARHGIACVPTLAVFSDRRVVDGIDDPGRLPAGGLFAKPAIERSGNGAALWRQRGDGAYLDQHGEPITGDQIFDTLKRWSVGRRYILQPALRVHDDLLDLSPDALATVRVITSRVGDSPVPMNANFKLPRAGAIADNMFRGAVASAVDLRTGTLGPAASLDLRLDRLDRHPDRDAPITGRRLPDWHAAVELCVEAHRRFDLSFIGWDVALTDRGPVIVEANTQPGHFPQNGPALAQPGFLDALLALAEADARRAAATPNAVAQALTPEPTESA